MKAVVVGSGGFLGSAVVRELARRGHSVIPLSSSKAEGIEPGTGLFRSRPRFSGDADVVLFFAQSPFSREVPACADHLFAVNCVAAVQAALAAREAGIRRFIYTSTGNVYAPSYAAHAESAPVRRDNWYSLSKVHAEEALALLRNELDVTVARLFGLYGPGQTGRLVPNLLNSIEAGREITLQPGPADGPTTGGLRVSLCHVADVARILVDLTPVRGVPTLNIASEETPDVRSIAEGIGRALGRSARFKVSDVARPFDLIADTSRLKALLAPCFIDLESGLRETVEAARPR
jgi:nucleoside-diphosphate-sugar epimerase